MSNFIFPKFREAIALQLLDLSSADWRVLAVMTNSDVLTRPEAEFIADFTTLAEFNGPGYSRVALTGEIVRVNVGALRVELDSDDIDFGVLAVGSLPIKGLIIHTHDTNDTLSRPAVWIDQTLSPGPHLPYTPIGVNTKFILDPTGFAYL